MEAKGGDSGTDAGASSGSGGGSGGSISITTRSAIGTADSVITVAGGDGKQGGGPGAGGWIYGYIQNSTQFTTNMTVNWHGRMNISEGLSRLLADNNDINIHKGQLSHPPCQKGFEGPL